MTPEVVEKWARAWGYNVNVTPGPAARMALEAALDVGCKPLAIFMEPLVVAVVTDCGFISAACKPGFCRRMETLANLVQSLLRKHGIVTMLGILLYSATIYEYEFRTMLELLEKHNVYNDNIEDIAKNPIDVYKSFIVELASARSRDEFARALAFLLPLAYAKAANTRCMLELVTSDNPEQVRDGVLAMATTCVRKVTRIPCGWTILREIGYVFSDKRLAAIQYLYDYAVESGYTIVDLDGCCFKAQNGSETLVVRIENDEIMVKRNNRERIMLKLDDVINNVMYRTRRVYTDEW